MKELLVRQFKSELNIVYGDGKKAKMDIYFPPDAKDQTKGKYCTWIRELGTGFTKVG